jgi:methylglutaconyl-CoA hydratase
VIQIHLENRIGYIILNRPEKRNALNDEMAAAFHKALNDFKDNTDCKIVIVKAMGEAFCAGADLGYLQKLQAYTYEQNLQDSTNLMQMFSALHHFPKITIAQVQGAALAGGCGLAGLADFCFATPDSKFGYTEVKIGFIPAIVSVFLSKKIGENAAKRLLLTGEIITAQEALIINLITKVVANEEIEKEVNNFAAQLVQSVSGESIALTKQLLTQMDGKSLDEQLNIAAQANAKARGTEDCKKGISAFLNKEKLSW